MNSPEDEATKQGNLLLDKGDFDGAIAAYTEGIRLHPQNAQPYCGRGQAYLRKRRIRQGYCGLHGVHSARFTTCRSLWWAGLCLS